MSDTPSVSEQTGIRSYEEYVQTRKVKSELGKDDFLALLAAQLQYQDPLEPTKDTDFIAQLAQFSTLQMMDDLTNTMTTYQYYSLTGQYVYAEVRLDTGEDVAIEGIVDCVIMKDGKAYAQVGDYMLDCSKISAVINKDVTSNNGLLSSTQLIGKSISANIYDDEGNATPVTGKCTRVAIEKQVLVAYLDSGDKVHKVGIGDIFDVSEPEVVIADPVGDNENNNPETQGDGGEGNPTGGGEEL